MCVTHCKCFSLLITLHIPQPTAWEPHGHKLMEQRTERKQLKQQSTCYHFQLLQNMWKRAHAPLGGVRTSKGGGCTFGIYYGHSTQGSVQRRTLQPPDGYTLEISYFFQKQKGSLLRCIWFSDPWTTCSALVKNLKALDSRNNQTLEIIRNYFD